jgi:hypothetical protein
VIRLVAAVVALYGTVATADEHGSGAAKLAQFTLAGCEFLKTHAVDPPDHRLGDDVKQAEHFGRVLRKERRGLLLNYHVQSMDFPTWVVSFWNHGVELKPPAETQLLLGELEKLFGAADVPDEDNAKPASVDGKARVRSERVEFARPSGHPLCRITATIEGGDAKGSRRVLMVRFSD